MEGLILVVIIILVVGTVIFFVLRQRDQSLMLMQQEIANLRIELNQNLNNITKQVQDRLSETSSVISDAHKTIGDRLDASSRAFSEVKMHLGELSEATKRIFEIGQSIVSLENILKAPKTRGTIGEYFLSEILKNSLPEANFSLQYRFKNGNIVDAIIKLKEGFVPVDAKFPYENFKRYTESGNEKYRREFLSDVKRHIDDIAKKYILQDEGTFGFALMFVPSENVYYEIAVSEQGIFSHSISKNIFPVSPNLFWLYLTTIGIGLRGMKVEENAKEIIMGIERLFNEFSSINSDFLQLEKLFFSATKKLEGIKSELNRFELLLNGLYKVKETTSM
ncbi:TPA: hypothetical protein DCX16_02975 [bacterium]|nr:hypothetical protein [bacterium]